MSESNPSVPPPSWRYAGDQLKRWRMKAGVSREELGAAARYAPDTIKSMEQGVRMPTAQLLDAADALFQAEGLLSAAKEYLSREKFPAQAVDFMAREREALSMAWYEVALIPGLLQTEAHARALISTFAPPLDDETVEKRVLGRMERQSLLTRTPPVSLSFVIYEAALRTPLIDRAQILRILESGELRNVSVQVLPFSRATSSAALGGPMVLLVTDDHERHAYEDGQVASHLTSEPEAVNAATERLSMIRAEALGAEESAQFLKRMVDEL
ncbi:helix-turn-helix transcriptional regulator [Streptomyces bambusae]|uniref:helix-turn-helix domain-containing protein n=1 Tax=Streptomyces bambusae TaxID=1550616 RepID=UPI001CFFC560|nr:helix-turn-helix transcriptional regulator [Streptomyces bambusae]MCB5170254.1 helix-turn-helix transcriptional regulator [Streptomyces bambusae]